VWGLTTVTSSALRPIDATAWPACTISPSLVTTSGGSRVKIPAAGAAISRSGTWRSSARAVWSSSTWLMGVASGGQRGEVRRTGT
jgi:hypothetical protein